MPKQVNDSNKYVRNIRGSKFFPNELWARVFYETSLFNLRS